MSRSGAARAVLHAPQTARLARLDSLYSIPGVTREKPPST